MLSVGCRRIRTLVRAWAILRSMGLGSRASRPLFSRMRPVSWTRTSWSERLHWSCPRSSGSCTLCSTVSMAVTAILAPK